MKTAAMWRLAVGPEPEYRWSDYTWIAPGPTAEDAMRHVVKKIKWQNERYRHLGCEDEEVPRVMFAVPFVLPNEAKSCCADRPDMGENFKLMFDLNSEVEVRL